MIQVVLVGAAGRMGRAVRQAASGASDLRIRALVDLPENRSPEDGVWESDPGKALTAGDVVIEFSSPAGARSTARACAGRGCPLVSGSTGLGLEDEAVLREAAGSVPVVRATNFSLGVAALRRLLRTALGTLPGSWDVEIVERHHRLKTDSPSGTALTLARDAADARRLTEAAFRHGREGRVGPRPQGEIGLHAVRGGSWVGDHEVLLAGEGEWIEIRHVAQDRSAFAHGALAAARFAAQASPGLYDLEDVLAKSP